MTLPSLVFSMFFQSVILSDIPQESHALQRFSLSLLRADVMTAESAAPPLDHYTAADYRTPAIQIGFNFAESESVIL
jgi:hypothetical protein